MMRLPAVGPELGKGDTGSVQIARPTAVARHPYHAGGRPPAPVVLEELMMEEVVRLVRRALLELPERTALILAMRFGIGPDDDGEHTLAEIAEEFGLSKERIRQLEAEGLEDLRYLLRGLA